MMMIRWNTPSQLLQYSLLALLTAQALIPGPPFTALWWLTLALAVLLGIQIRFWPTHRTTTYLYLGFMAVLLFALTLLDQDFMYMIFSFSVISALTLPLPLAFGVAGTLCLGLEGILAARYGWADIFYPGLILVAGSLSFAYSYYLQERSEKEREETQRLLDELREAHLKLEEYAGKVQDLAALEERNRLARELHDSVKQQAFAVSAQLGAARSLLKSQPEQARDHLLNAEALMDDVRRELGQLIYELRPAALQDRGLAEALQDWGQGWSQQCGIALQVHVQQEAHLPLETGQALFRITQEALSNIARHSAASNAEVCLAYEGDSLLLSICDDGRGFDPALMGNGFGMQSMRERAERLPGGRLDVHSQAGQGTQVQVRCNYSPDNAANRSTGSDTNHHHSDR